MDGQPIYDRHSSRSGRLLGQASEDHLSREELRTVVNEAGALIPARHKDMLVSILDLENVTVNDIMVPPRNEVVGIDLEDDTDTILRQLRSSQHTRLPIFKGDINNIQGILHLRSAARLLQETDINKAMIMQLCQEPYFIPESTALNTQLLNFQKGKRRFGIVVDEYGDVLGLATLEDILEEIVGGNLPPIMPPPRPTSFPPRTTAPLSSMAVPPCGRSTRPWAGICQPMARKP